MFGFKKIKKNVVEIKEDIEKESRALKTFYSNPIYYISKIHWIVYLSLAFYLAGYLLFNSFFEIEGFLKLFLKISYVISGYYFLVWIYRYTKVHRNNKDQVEE